MALATQCPHCHTTFRVAHDQLKLRAGLVRCGACKQIFNGIENLLRPDQPPTVAPTAPGNTAARSTPAIPPAPETIVTTAPTQAADEARPAIHSVPEAPGPSLQNTVPSHPESPQGVDFYLPEEDKEKEEKKEEAIGHPDAAQPESRVEPETEHAAEVNSGVAAEASPYAGIEAESEGEAQADRHFQPNFAPPAKGIAEQEARSVPAHEPEDPMLRMTLMDFSEHQPGTSGTIGPEWQHGQPDPLERAMADLERKPLRAPDEDSYAEPEADDGGDEPSFVRQGRRRERRSRAWRVVMSIGSLLLLLALLAQAAYVFRDQLAARFPQTKPALLEACAYLDCQVGLPAQIDVVSIESSELQTLAPNSSTLVLTLLLRNHGAIAQAWPHLELSLNDNAEKTQVRRAFSPTEYLPREINPRLGFPAQSEQPVRLYFEPEGVSASGYRVYLFYP